jgi:hypothetical protein
VTPATAREQVGEFLRVQRRAARVGLGDIAHVTRIPERSLRHLEAGEFDKLPADVFVRGFIRAYAKTIGIDAEDAVRRYTVASAARVSNDQASEPRARAFAAAEVATTGALPDAGGDAEASASFIPRMLRAAEPASRRGPITLAVIILVIVATLTMSYLLRRPTYSEDGLTRATGASRGELRG